MNFKTTYILFGVLVGMLVLFLLTQVRGKRPGTKETAYVFPTIPENNVKPNDINGVEVNIHRPHQTKLEFARRDDGWWVLAPNVRADSSLVNQIITQLSNAGKEEKADMSANLAMYGLDSPAAVITLRQGSERSWTLTLGKASPGKESALVYVTSSDRPGQPLAIRRMQIDSVIKDIDAKGDIDFKGVKDFRTKTLLTDTAFDINKVTLQAPPKEAMVLDKAADGRWHFEKPAYGEAESDGEPAPAGAPPDAQRITGVRELTQAIADLRVESDDDFGPTGATDAELADKGLEKGKETLRIEVRVQSALGGEDKKPPVTAALLVGKKADDKGDKLYARLEDERNIEKVSAKKVEAIQKVLADPSLVRNRDLVQADAARVDAIDVKPADRGAFRLRKTGEPAVWKVYDSGKVQEADNTAVQGLLTAVTAKRQVKEFPEASRTDADLGLDKPAVVLSLWVEGLKKEEKKEEVKKDEEKKDAKKEEKKDAKAEAKKEEKKDPNAEPKLKEETPTVRLSFGKKEKDLVYVLREVGTEKTRLAVPATLLDKVSEGKVAYLERRLPSFGSVADVAKVTLTRGNATYEIDKVTKDDKSPSSWKLKQPKELAGRTADPGKMDRLIGDLHDLQAERFVTEAPTANDLDRFGLAAPSVRAVLTVTKPDKKTEDRAYLFGKETDDKSGVYAKEGSRDMVFVVRHNVVEAFQGDLQDPTVFSFELAKVKALRMTGWSDINGSPSTLELERKGPQQWTAKVPATYKANGAKVENFVSGLANLRADRFLGPKGAGKAEYKLDQEEGSLDVVVTVDGEKEPYTLTIGGPSGNDGYYATSNRLPNEVFVLPKGILADVKAKPAYFK